jgi:cell division septum initiation protein DivIVA
MDTVTNGPQKEEFRLSAEQQAEIGDILLSARAVSRQMIAQARQQAEELLQNANERADALVREAEEKADAILTDAGEQALKTTQTAEAQAAETIRAAEEKAAELLRETGVREAESSSAEEELPEDKKDPTAPAISEEMQEYVVRCVGDCFARLRQQQLDTADYINEQWRSFLSDLSLPELPTPDMLRKEEKAVGDEVSRQEIEERVSAIAKELMEIIGK